MRRHRIALALVLAVVAPCATAATAQDIPLRNWSVPSAASGKGREILADIGYPGLFVPVTPCRQYDSRATTALPQNTPRTVTLSGAPCGIPSATNAIAVNITIFNITGALSNGVFKVDIVSPPAVAWINYPPTETQRANAGVVAVSSGALVVQVNQGAGSVDFVIDVNGYFIDAGGVINPGEFVGVVGTEDTGGLLYSYNLTTANFFTNSAVRGRISNTNPSQAIYGEQLAVTGVNYGVFGSNNSTTNDSAGVLGRGGPGFSIGAGLAPSGVRGESGGGVGVFGVSTFIGAGGRQVDGAGAVVSVGYIGYSGYALFGIGNSSVTGSKAFVDPHPTDARKVIKYLSLEGPESGTYFRGRARFENRVSVISVPDDFRLVSDEGGLTVHVTPIGRQASVWVTRMDLNEIVVESTRDVEFSYIVHGVRKAFRDFTPIQENVEFVPESAGARMPLGFSDEQKARLVANGTYNQDGTVNMHTAERLGWAQAWQVKARIEAERASQPSTSQAPAQSH